MIFTNANLTLESENIHLVFIFERQPIYANRYFSVEKPDIANLSDLMTLGAVITQRIFSY